jgi:hypothetical protein
VVLSWFTGLMGRLEFGGMNDDTMVGIFDELIYGRYACSAD